MTQQKASSPKDAYLENITAQIKEVDKQIEAALPKKLLEKKADLEAIRSHYLKFIKEAAKK